jgi:hypothetical protein
MNDYKEGRTKLRSHFGLVAILIYTACVVLIIALTHFVKPEPEPEPPKDKDVAPKASIWDTSTAITPVECRVGVRKGSTKITTAQQARKAITDALYRDEVYIYVYVY